MKTNKIVLAMICIVLIMAAIPCVFAKEAEKTHIIATHYYGDSTLDDVLNTGDATLILKICADSVAVQTEQTELTYEGYQKIDANKDNALNTADATFVLQVCADMRAANEYYEYAQDKATIKISCYDEFNEIEVTETTEMTLDEGENVINAGNIVLPENYRLCDMSYSATVIVEGENATPSELRVNVLPVMQMEDGEFTMIYTRTGFEKVERDLSMNYIMATDIELSVEDNRKPFGWGSDEDVHYTGIFDGNGYKITGLYINYALTDDMINSNIGLFAINDGTIRNLYIYTKPYEGGTYGVFGHNAVGIVVGKNYGKVENCHTYGNVGTLYDGDMEYYNGAGGGAGGIVGNNMEGASVTRCSFEGGAEGYHWVGGIIGKNYAAVSECYFAGAINSQVSDQALSDWQIRCIGGICGGISYGSVENCYAIPTISFKADNSLGGISGWAKGGSITNAFVTNTDNIIYVSGDAGDDVGYQPSEKISITGFYCTTGDTINGGMLPASFSEDIWSMEGACLPGCPDLRKNKRPNAFFEE